MSKIINKKQLDFLIESTLKEYNPYNDWTTSTGGDEDAYSSNPHHRNHDNYNPPTDLEIKKLNPTERGGDNKNSVKNEDYMKDTCPECGHKMDEEGLCESGCGSMDYMKEDEESIKNPGKYMGKAKQKAGVDDDGDGVPNGADKDPKDGDVTEASVKDLAESVTKTFNPTFLTENMDNFTKLINYRNK